MGAWSVFAPTVPATEGVRVSGVLDLPLLAFAEETIKGVKKKNTSFVGNLPTNSQLTNAEIVGFQIMSLSECWFVCLLSNRLPVFRHRTGPVSRQQETT